MSGLDDYQLTLQLRAVEVRAAHLLRHAPSQGINSIREELRYGQAGRGNVAVVRRAFFDKLYHFV
ncbi:MAG TPA: hypothetical protein DEF77_02230 [Gammaproteobacteria bacterium]|nr:hypothetical protein [Gammaproteobacteria bacterium]